MQFVRTTKSGAAAAASIGARLAARRREELLGLLRPCFARPEPWLLIAAAVRSLQHDGAEGMSFTGVLSASGAARGAIYHHFPRGKSQLVAEAAADNGSEVRARLAQLPAESPAAVVRGFLATSPTMETSMEGVFAAGDVRSGSTKQLGSAVGDGIAALLMTRRYLEAHHHKAAPVTPAWE